MKNERSYLLVLVCLVLLMLPACEQTPTPKVDPLGLGSKTATLEMRQRSIQTVPGVMGRISLKIGDVETGDGVESVSVVDHKDESEVVKKGRMQKGGVVEFKIDKTNYYLTLVDTDPTHVLNDTATFAIEISR